ncbi:MAG: hypothetical protein Q4F41_12925 [Eubacteriales bacterium]|nr:hypothetical protein [Eubacteriales bacterium]
MEKKEKSLWWLLAMGIAVAWYWWDLWYYGGLFGQKMLKKHFRKAGIV